MTWNGDILRMTRRAAGKTQEELVEALGGKITQAALSRYEASLREPESEDVVESLAHALGVTSRYLRAGERTFPMVSATAHMRRQLTASPATWKDLEARLNVTRIHWDLLVDSVDISPDFEIPTFDGTADLTAADAAVYVRERWRMPLGPVENLVGWLESAGAVVVIEDFGTDRVDGMSQWVGRWPVISLNSRAPADRRRLTAAHELGHLVLHNTAPALQMEQEANDFAAEFLMPRAEIRPQLRSSGLSLGRLMDLKVQWGVSMQALFEHAYRMGLATGEQRTRFYQGLNAKRWKKVEPYSELIPEELPRLASHLVDALLTRGLSPAEVAQMAGLADFHGTPLWDAPEPAPRRLVAVK